MLTSAKILSPLDLVKLNKRLSQYLLPTPKNPHVMKLYKLHDWTITVYYNNKVLVQGKDAQNFWIKPVTNTSFASATMSDDYIGCDEVGVGDYFGGLVTCAVYLKKCNQQALINLGVTDSKNLTDTQMYRIYPKLTKLIQHNYLSYLPSEYNELIAKYHNTHIVKALMHDLTIKQLITKFKLTSTTSVVLDQFVESNKYYEYFEKIKTHPYSITKFVTGAEKKYLAVAAASIIARIKFLEQIKQLQNKSCAKIYLGASNPKIIPSAKQIYQQGGIDLLKRFVKIDFKTTKQVIG